MSFPPDRSCRRGPRPAHVGSRRDADTCFPEIDGSIMRATSPPAGLDRVQARQATVRRACMFPPRASARSPRTHPAVPPPSVLVLPPKRLASFPRRLRTRVRHEGETESEHPFHSSWRAWSRSRDRKPRRRGSRRVIPEHQFARDHAAEEDRDVVLEVPSAWEERKRFPKWAPPTPVGLPSNQDALICTDTRFPGCSRQPSSACPAS